MWYFSWILGIALAAGFGILCALWYELKVVGFKGHDPYD